jgi:N-acetylglucosamine malate deacetylase 1
MSRRILVISPHPDDESIGCGGTIRKHVVEGDAVHVVFLTSGEKGGHGRDEKATIKIRERESAAAQRILGIEAIEFYREPDAALRVRTPAVKRIGEHLRRRRPDVVYVPHGREMHADHRAAVRIVRAALDRVANRYRPTVLMYEIWTPLQRMDRIVDITPYVNDKRRAIRAYRSQCDVMDFENAIIGLNRYRGEMFCWPDGDYAEVFAILDY